MFNKIILAGVAAAVAATPALAAAAPAPQHRQVVTTVKQRPNGTVVQKRVVRQTPAHYNRAQVNHRKWQRGQRFDRRYATNYRQVDYRRYNRLYAPPRGYQWVQSGNDAVLIAVASGLIGAVIGGALF